MVRLADLHANGRRVFVDSGGTQLTPGNIGGKKSVICLETHPPHTHTSSLESLLQEDISNAIKCAKHLL